METKQKYTNRLIQETSPYLLQHAHNPVDWFAWGEEALNKAKEENKPILLSIGYSSCHWCHVMEKESFENDEIARIMNECFVNIKVDREERPDLDELYMNAVQAMTGSGGWPLTLFLTPDLVPFHGGTYFPPEDRGGMPGFQKVLTIVSNYYRTHREDVKKTETQLKEALDQMVEIPPSREALGVEPLRKAFAAMQGQFDPTYGGFGRAPKFPSSMALSFLLRYWKKFSSGEALEMVDLTLGKMANGGIYDHLGGGFHRYSVDERWLIPHFEKMLYDNALLSRSYFEGYLVTGKDRYRRVAEEILQYVLREMTSPEGGFYSTQDADSEGGEGKFYVWSRDQVKEVLGKEKGVPFSVYYGVTQQGNFEGASSVLHIETSLEKASGRYGMPVKDFEELLAEGRKKLFSEREKRVKPRRDEKILASWNGLMISSFTQGFEATGNEQYLQAAERAAHFVLREMKKDGYLMRAYKDGIGRVRGYSEDYAFVVQALISLYEATFEVNWLKEADKLNQEMVDQFWDERDGGVYLTGKDSEELLARSKSPYDNVLPSPNSVAVFNLIKLGYLTGDESLKGKTEKTLHLFYNFLSQHPSGFAHMLSSLSFFLDPEEVGIVGPKNDPRTQSLVRTVYLSYLPNRILSLMDPGEPVEEYRFPSLKEKGVAEVPSAFVCRRFSCLPPVTDGEELRKILK